MNNYSAWVSFQRNGSNEIAFSGPFYFSGLKRDAKSAIRQQFLNSMTKNQIPFLRNIKVDELTKSSP